MFPVSQEVFKLIEQHALNSQFIYFLTRIFCDTLAKAVKKKLWKHNFTSGDLEKSTEIAKHICLNDCNYGVSYF